MPILMMSLHGSDDSQIVGHILLEKLFTDHVAFYYTKGVFYLILLGEGRKVKAKKYHVNTFIIMDPPKTRRLFKTQHLCLL